MEQISFYLEKFKTFKIKNEDIKNKIIGIVKKETKVVLNKKDILVLKNGTIKIIKIGPEKATIFLNKNKIEKEIEKEII